MAVVLMAYASRNGSTRGIAERIAASLDEYGNQVEVHPVDRAPEVDGYDAAVLGCGVYGGAWPTEAQAYVRRNQAALVCRPVWLFSVGLGPAAAEQGFRFAGMLAGENPKVVGQFSDTIGPRDHHVFAGAIQPGHLSRMGRLFYRGIRGKYGDFRDWKDVDAWSDTIARQLADD
ncbi:flavodoxin domain-containing protein [Actinopolymorpha singaporensis]|uniref:Menaquinone-dependent protoporphyrinogen oxidase n=1 Tax=Actinopolymorpha singaporensis TaxID=117157 RepID=A0A1H1T416_9ACTN|nr:flavodoxin domain-containing protein [Actinopolymorpha singaporensis]SDS54409.1 menaquinone-dependent protoporphyrinogen oxidase [Actinopolymorpha singaporensis]